MKNGLDWFPLNVYPDERIELIEAEFGVAGFAVVVKLLQRIYGGEGYFCKWYPDVRLLFSRACGLRPETVEEILQAALKRGIFDEELFKEHAILTSETIQRNYFAAVARRKETALREDFLLIPPPQRLRS